MKTKPNHSESIISTIYIYIITIFYNKIRQTKSGNNERDCKTANSPTISTWNRNSRVINSKFPRITIE